jgi:hypothetical protein
MRTYVRVWFFAGHIPFSRFHAALQAGDLAFVRRHRASLTPGLVDEIRVAELTAPQDPGGLEAQAPVCLRRFAKEAAGQKLEDYVWLDPALRAISYDPEMATGQLLALCAARAIE